MHNHQRNCILENIRQEIYAKIGVRVTVYRQLWIPVFLFSRSLKIGVNFAFVLTPKSAVKSCRRNSILYWYSFSGRKKGLSLTTKVLPTKGKSSCCRLILSLQVNFEENDRKLDSYRDGHTDRLIDSYICIYKYRQIEMVYRNVCR